MPSLYQDQVDRLNPQAYRVWLVMLLVGLTFTTMHWLDRCWNNEPEQILCLTAPDSRFQDAVFEDGLYWTADLNAAIQCAYRNNRQILIASDGVSNVNGVINKRSILRHKAIQKNLKRYILVVLYLDLVPPDYYRNPAELPHCREDALANFDWQRKTLGTAQVPLYTVLQPTSESTYRVIESYDEGRITNESAFDRFLRNPQTWRENAPAPFWQRIVEFVKRP